MRVLPCLILAALVEAPRPASACSLVGNDDHQLDSTHANDTVAPSAVSATYELHRSAESAGCGGVSSCGDIASISVEVHATDDAAPVDKLGYQVRVVGGDVPKGLNIPTQAVGTYGDDTLHFYFSYGDQSGFAFDLEIRARDLNGNLGPPTIINIAEPSTDGGCTTGRSPTYGAALLALAFVLVRRRRRRATT